MNNNKAMLKWQHKHVTKYTTDIHKEEKSLQTRR